MDATNMSQAEDDYAALHAYLQLVQIEIDEVISGGLSQNRVPETEIGPSLKQVISGQASLSGQKAMDKTGTRNGWDTKPPRGSKKEKRYGMKRVESFDKKQPSTPCLGIGPPEVYLNEFNAVKQRGGRIGGGATRVVDRDAGVWQMSDLDDLCVVDEVEDRDVLLERILNNEGRKSSQEDECSWHEEEVIKTLNTNENYAVHISDRATPTDLHKLIVYDRDRLLGITDKDNTSMNECEYNRDPVPRSPQFSHNCTNSRHHHRHHHHHHRHHRHHRHTDPGVCTPFLPDQQMLRRRSSQPSQHYQYDQQQFCDVPLSEKDLLHNLRQERRAELLTKIYQDVKRVNSSLAPEQTHYSRPRQSLPEHVPFGYPAKIKKDAKQSHRSLSPEQSHYLRPRQLVPSHASNLGPSTKTDQDVKRSYRSLSPEQPHITRTRQLIPAPVSYLGPSTKTDQDVKRAYRSLSPEQPHYARPMQRVADVTSSEAAPIKTCQDVKHLKRAFSTAQQPYLRPMQDMSDAGFSGLLPYLPPHLDIVEPKVDYCSLEVHDQDTDPDMSTSDRSGTDIELKELFNQPINKCSAARKRNQSRNGYPNEDNSIITPPPGFDSHNPEEEIWIKVRLVTRSHNDLRSSTDNKACSSESNDRKDILAAKYYAVPFEFEATPKSKLCGPKTADDLHIHKPLSSAGLDHENQDVSGESPSIKSGSNTGRSHLSSSSQGESLNVDASWIMPCENSVSSVSKTRDLIFMDGHRRQRNNTGELQCEDSMNLFTRNANAHPLIITDNEIDLNATSNILPHASVDWSTYRFQGHGQSTGLVTSHHSDEATGKVELNGRIRRSTIWQHLPISRLTKFRHYQPVTDLVSFETQHRKLDIELNSNLEPYLDPNLVTHLDLDLQLHTDEDNNNNTKTNIESSSMCLGKDCKHLISTRSHAALEPCFTEHSDTNRNQGSAVNQSGYGSDESSLNHGGVSEIILSGVTHEGSNVITSESRFQTQSNNQVHKINPGWEVTQTVAECSESSLKCDIGSDIKPACLCSLSVNGNSDEKNIDSDFQTQSDNQTTERIRGCEVTQPVSECDESSIKRGVASDIKPVCSQSLLVKANSNPISLDSDFKVQLGNQISERNCGCEIKHSMSECCECSQKWNVSSDIKLSSLSANDCDNVNNQQSDAVVKKSVVIDMLNTDELRLEKDNILSSNEEVRILDLRNMRRKQNLSRILDGIQASGKRIMRKSTQKDTGIQTSLDVDCSVNDVSDDLAIQEEVVRDGHEKKSEEVDSRVRRSPMDRESNESCEVVKEVEDKVHDEKRGVSDKVDKNNDNEANMDVTKICKNNEEVIETRIYNARRPPKVSFLRSKSIHGRDLNGGEIRGRKDLIAKSPSLCGSLRELSHLNIDVSQRLVDGEERFVVHNGSPELQVVVNALTPVLSRRNRGRNARKLQNVSPAKDIPRFINTSPNISDTASAVSEENCKGGFNKLDSSPKVSEFFNGECENEPVFTRLNSYEGLRNANGSIDFKPVVPERPNGWHGRKSIDQIQDKRNHFSEDAKTSKCIDAASIEGNEKDLTFNIDAEFELDLSVGNDALVGELQRSSNSLFLSPKLAHTWHGVSPRSVHRPAPRMGVGRAFGDGVKFICGPDGAIKQVTVSSSSQTTSSQYPQNAYTLPVISRTLLDALHKRYCSHQYSGHYQTQQPFSLLTLDSAFSSGNHSVTALLVEPRQARSHAVQAAPPSPEVMARLKMLSTTFGSNRDKSEVQSLLQSVDHEQPSKQLTDDMPLQQSGVEQHQNQMELPKTIQGEQVQDICHPETPNSSPNLREVSIYQTKSE